MGVGLLILMAVGTGGLRNAGLFAALILVLSDRELRPEVR